MDRLPETVAHYFDLQSGKEAPEQTIQYMYRSASFRGSQLWTLIIAIIIASVGLNMNSTAVIIGAMLISPLMGPIMSAGFALATYDFALFQKAIKNQLIAVVISIMIATFYFSITPFKEVHSELLARTSPNIFDVIIALSGGIAGIISVTRIEKGNPLPGVAIATALMPPLCTAGYALSIGNLEFFIGATYLFLINSVFIFLATFIVTRYLSYPVKQFIDLSQQRLIQRILTVSSFLIMIPAIWFAYSLYSKERFLSLANSFIKEEFTSKGVIILEKSVLTRPERQVQISVLGKHYSSGELTQLSMTLNSKYGGPGIQLEVNQNPDPVNIDTIKEAILNEINNNQNILSEDEKTIQKLQEVITRNTIDNQSILSEIRILFPNITEMQVFNPNWNTDESRKSYIGIYESSGSTLDGATLQKVSLWLTRRLKIRDIELFHRPSREEESASGAQVDS